MFLLVKLIVWSSLILLVLGFGLTLLVRRFENGLVFFPSRNWDFQLENYSPSKEIRFHSVDGVELSGAWFEAPAARAVILYCHGNGGNLSHRIETADFWRREFGVSVFLFDYQGYGRSQGQPSEEGIFQDARAAFREVGTLSEKGPLLVYGRSLGTVPAVRLALEEGVSGLILDSPLTNASEMAGRVVPIPGIGFLTSFRLNNLLSVPQIRVPLLVIHGERDRIIPVDLGRRVFEAAPEPKKFVLLEGQGHNDPRRNEAFLGAFRAFIEAVQQ